MLLIVSVSSLFFTNSALALTPPPLAPLEITSPIGKTVWQLGNSHTISWSPNPDNSNIEAFFETKKGKKFQTYGKLLPCGKGSIIWCGDIDETPENTTDTWKWAKTGTYYLSIVDKVTGQRARTKDPIKLVARGEVIKLKAFAIDNNGQKIQASDTELTYVNLSERKIPLQWNSKADSCRVEINDGYNSTEYVVKKTGKQTFDLFGNAAGYSVFIICDKGSNSQAQQFSVNIEGAVGNPSITVLYPNGGEIIQLGGKDVDFRTTWESNNLKGDVGVYVHFKDGGLCYIGTTDVTSGVFTTSLGSNYRCPNVPQNLTDGEEYRVSLYADNGDSSVDFVAKDSSDNYFTILNSNTQPSIEVLSPNGGEQLFSGESTTINVVTNLTDKQTAGITLQLYRYVDGKDFPYMYVQDIEKEWVQGFPYTWSVPFVESGQYVIYASAIPNFPSKDITDFSDKPFTITNSSNSSCTFTRDLTLGSTGTDVGNLQNFLISKEFQLGEKGDIAYFGVSTQTALAQYQTSVGISPANGYFGPMTRAKVTIDCKGSLEPFIKILSPNGGENYKAGDNIVITWESNLPKEQNLQFAIMFGNREIGKEITTVKAGDKSYVWKSEYIDSIINTESIPPQTIYSDGTFKIWLYCPNTDAICIGKNESNYVDESDNSFTIQSATTIPIRQPRPRVVLPATPSANTGMISTVDLELGMSHPGIIAIQKFLNSNGYTIESVTGKAGSIGYESDYFGEKTKQALIRYQKDNGIKPAQGYFGPQTRAMMGI